jgi:RNA polymerase sigma-70 factor (ECF subfamily)
VAWEDLTANEQAAARSLAAGASAAEASAARDLASRALETLPLKDRQTLVLADALGYSAAEAGRIMGCTPLAVRLRLHRARRAMRQAAERLLEGMEGGERGGSR